MLTISKPLSASQAQTYHAKEFTAAEQNYWKQGDTIQGEWHGRLAEKFGLAGVVGAEEFACLSEGQHPETREQLVKHRKVHEYQTEDGKTVAPVEHRAGWDATFSAPKSVSLTALVGGDDRVREAHREAVNVALNELERYTQARIGGNLPDPELLKAVEHLSKNETAIGVQMLREQQRVTEIVDPQQRIEAIARSYAASPENTIIVSPDNASRRKINQAVRRELQTLGTLEKEEHSLRVLTPRSDMTGADRAWAAGYQNGDVLRYTRGSKELGIEGGSYSQIVTVNSKDNLLTVEKQNGEQVTYDPSRLRGINAYREIEREFAIGDRIQLTAPNRALQTANRDLGTLPQIDTDGRLTIRIDGGKEKTVTFDPREMRHFDHGYAVTSHSSQGMTSERVLVNMDTDVHPKLINSRFAYVSVSRASHEAHIYTNNAATLAEKLGYDASKTSAIDFTKILDNSIQPGVGRPKMLDPNALGLSL